MSTSALAHQSISHQRLTEARARTDEMFRLLRPDAIYERPVPERHRLIFYLGHLEAFDWNQIARFALGQPSFNPAFDKLFEAGIDPEPGRLPHDQPSDWPDRQAVEEYSRETRLRLDEMLGEVPPQSVNMVIEHREMHAETFAYLMHNLPYALKPGGRTPAGAPAPGPSNPMLDIPAGRATLGQHPDEFGWDNEFARHTRQVPAFAISKFKVTNGEYLRFVNDGAPPPHFWTRQEGAWFLRGMFNLVALPLDWPVYVTHAEAVAYAEWAGKALPTEAQFHRAAYSSPSGEERQYPWGSAPPSRERGNFDFHRWDPEPVTAHPAGESAYGVAQLVGNGWEWTSTVFEPFEGFRNFDYYPGYSKNFFDGDHYVIKGGSARTAAGLLRRSFRNWFRPNYPYVYAGFRLVEN
jgi:formylglycine-generating enzyme required for sulfatase activity